MKNIIDLRRWSTKASKVGSKRYELEFFLVNILYRISFKGEPDLGRE